MKERRTRLNPAKRPIRWAPASLAAASAVLVLAVAGAPRAFRPGPAAARPVRVLILSGQNNHDWKTTTPKIQSILERSGRFVVDITARPDLLTEAGLAPYDVVLSDWNAYGRDPAVSAWPAEAGRTLLDFVRRGKGHVTVHAGSSSFPEWADYRRMTLAAWKESQSSHGPRHEFPVRIDQPNHPVTAGVGPFKTTDELWNRPGLAEGVQVLASSFSAADQGGTGQWEPTALAGRFGEGRSFTLLLGHDAAAMDNPGFQALLRRGVEWAATGSVAPDAPPERDGWRWEIVDGASVALIGRAGVLWRFRYDASLDVPSIHPLNSADGRTLSWDRPPDHLWHHGLWFSWKFIDRINYWEMDSKTGRPAGRTTWSNVRVETRNDRSARIRMDLAYRPAGEEAPVLTEKRTIEISAPDGAGVYAVDWSGEFAAVRPVVLDRTPLPGEPGGQTYGGYAGLSLRLAGALSERRPMTSDGPIVQMLDDRYRGRHIGLDYSGLIDGCIEGVAILDHARNPRTPSPWYVIRSAEMSFFTPAFLCYEPMTIAPGQTFALRYRVMVHPGRWDEARLRTEFARFSRLPSETR
jgi:type 1 glutamine amidotransferase